jgi:hypothetical protein
MKFRMSEAAAGPKILIFSPENLSELKANPGTVVGFVMDAGGSDYGLLVDFLNNCLNFQTAAQIGSH